MNDNFAMQSLEGRRMLSAAVDSGVLTITGTSRADQITVSLSSDGETLVVSERSSKSRFKKAITTKTEFTATEVTSIVVNAGAGNDSVQIRGNRDGAIEIPASIDGGDGNDKLFGGAGNDTIAGGAGDDDLFGRGGTDSLDGGDGEDLLDGGADVDTLFGGAGNDLLLTAGDDAIDVLDGGDDDAEAGEDDGDLAVIDDDETATNATVSDLADIVVPPPFKHGPPIFGGGVFGPGGGHKGGGRH